MEIYNAIMAASDQIEQRPESFDFHSMSVPNNCGTPGCALGWIGVFLQVRKHPYRSEDYSNLNEIGHRMGIAGDDPDAEFYCRMDELMGLPRLGLRERWGYGPWSDNSRACASTLRRYAAKYHAPAVGFTGLPDIVRDIFRAPLRV